MSFEKALEFVLKHEGGEVNDPRDPGGHTNMGISRRAYPNEDIANMTKDRAAYLYRRDYWDKIRGRELPFPVALCLFDMAVNAGPSGAVTCLQRALGVGPDGVIGPKTLEAARKLGTSRLARFAEKRILYYSSLSGWQYYKKAWTRRTLEALEMALEHCHGSH